MVVERYSAEGGGSSGTSLIDVLDRVPALQVAGAHAKEKLREAQIDCRNYAYEHGTDKPDVADWRWPG